jgi:hypothetical protein
MVCVCYKYSNLVCTVVVYNVEQNFELHLYPSVQNQCPCVLFFLNFLRLHTNNFELLQHFFFLSSVKTIYELTNHLKLQEILSSRIQIRIIPN